MAFGRRRTKTREEQNKQVAETAARLIATVNPWSDLIRSYRYGSTHDRPTREWELAALFGVPMGHHLPDEHKELWCQGIKVVLLTKEESRKMGYSTHRVMQQCNGCKELIPAGRMHQHLSRLSDTSNQMYCMRRPMVRLIHDVRHAESREIRYKAGTIVHALDATNLPCWKEKGFMFINEPELEHDPIGILLDKTDYERLSWKS